MTKIRTRFAPSPTGYLHLGHAASAQAAFGFARKYGGVCLLRIEDIDKTRCKPEFERAIYEDLDWLGFDWPLPARRQSNHFKDYQGVLEILQEKNLIYRCFKTRKEILEDIARAPHGHSNVYFGPDTPLSKGAEQVLVQSKQPYAWRLSFKSCQKYLGQRYDDLSFINNSERVKINPALLGDIILARKDVGTSYHIACCHDDALQGITDIVRGTDLLETTHIHRLLQEIMDWPVPKYHHHALLMDSEGKRFAKRDNAATLRALRQTGALPENILAQIKSIG
ncbi:MAG: tRNA glutamyl-Q(34) synthetase GluQRS [Robiginitomaculum sp.]